MLEKNNLYNKAANNLDFTPSFFRLLIETDKKEFEILLSESKVSFIHDEIYSQLQELIKCLNPSIKINPAEYKTLIHQHLKGQVIDNYGVWVYYPWSRRLVHILDEQEFVHVRTNRNQFKITKKEQELLQTKKIGVVGLSVGQSIALTMVLERTCGEIRLADFDTAELSNFNRLRTGLHNLGINKAILAAREIMEIDPFIRIRIFQDGLGSHNMNQFFTEGGLLDLFIEVCDGMDIKIESRLKARELKIPVVMDTNDRGMLDIERFDLEPNRPILHGLADGLDATNIKNLSVEDKIPYILKIVGAETISTRLKASMMEVEQSINTWPQLASSVVLGGALTTDICRRILLGQFNESGRYYVDFDELIKDKNFQDKTLIPDSYIAPPELTTYEMLSISKNFRGGNESNHLPEEVMNEIINAAILAPSGGNAQPWKFLYTKKGLFIFHDVHFSHSMLDFNHLGSYVAIGSVIENIEIKASTLGFKILINYFPVKEEKKFIAHISFKKANISGEHMFLEKGIGLRVTNRMLSSKETLPKNFYDHIKSLTIPYGAELHIIEDEVRMNKLGNILAEAEMLRILNPRGHYDTFKNELRWTNEEIFTKRDGLDVNTLGLTRSELSALKIAEDNKAIEFVREIKGGAAFKKMVMKSVACSSSLGIITMPTYSELNFLEGGRAMERIWIESNLSEISIQPITQLVFMLERFKHANKNEIGENEYNTEVGKLYERFQSLFPELMNKQLIFIFRLSKAGSPKVRSIRRHIESVFVYLKDD